MRDQGRLVEWFDEKGYGFIQPEDLSKARVFLHIKDFARQGPRPIVGCALDYQVILDEKGRYRAQKVLYLKASQTKKKKVQSIKNNTTKQPLKPMQILCVAYIIFIAVLVLLSKLESLYVLFIGLMNIATYWFYLQDKEASQLNNRRVPENILHLLSFLGGWPAAYLAQERLRHKIQKQTFQSIYFCTIAFNVLLNIWLISPLNTF